MDNIQFSVLMSVYKNEKPHYLKQALESIWENQSLKPNQIVIVKDGPLSEELDSILHTFSKIAPVEFIINEINLGLSKSLNIGLSFCKYNIVARMDTDDISHINRFKKQIEYLRSNIDVDIVGTFAQKIDENGTETGLMRVPVSNNDIYKLIWTCPFIHPTVMFKKESINKAGSYNPNSGPRQDDYDLWFRCAFINLSFANIDEVLFYYRFSIDNIRKNDIKVGWYRIKVGFSSCKKLKCSFWSYIGVTMPLIRSLLPYPLNVYFHKMMSFINPRTN